MVRATAAYNGTPFYAAVCAIAAYNGVLHTHTYTHTHTHTHTQTYTHRHKYTYETQKEHVCGSHTNSGSHTN